MIRRIGSLLLAAFVAFGISVAQAGEADAGKKMRAKSSSGGGHGHRRQTHGHRHHGRHHHRSYFRHHYPYGYGYGFGYGYGYRGRWWGPYSPTWRVSAEERGFAYLVGGDPKRAISVFAKRAEANPENALPKLGYSIAMSELGELELGVWAMRRAIRTDPQALRGVNLDDRLRPRVAALLDVYHPADHAAPHGEDAHFMAAALLWVLGDTEGAGSAIAAAAADGDEHHSTLALSRALSGIQDLGTRGVTQDAG